jgi:hypothetical protein
MAAATSPRAVDTEIHPKLEALARSPHFFEPNVGQAGIGAEFFCRTGSGLLLLTRDAAVFALGEAPAREPGGEAGRSLERRKVAAPGPLHLVRMRVVGARSDAALVGEKRLASTSNYLIGDDPAAWRTNVPNFASVRYRGIYEGIDMLYYSRDGQLEYDFILAPGADFRAIRLAFDGAKQIEIAPEGDLVVLAGDQVLRVHKPQIYQEIRGERHARAGRFLVDASGEVQFVVASHDPRYSLVIDPILDFSSYTPRFDLNIPGIGIDAGGNVYIACLAFSANFPLVDPLQPTLAGVSDMALTKLDPTGTTILYSTFVGGQSQDAAYDVAVGGDGGIALIGLSISTDFPTVNALQPEYAGTPSEVTPGYDAAVAKIAPSGSSLVYSTYFGGSGEDRAFDVDADALGNVYIGGDTTSTDLPLLNPFQSALGDAPGCAECSDAYCAKIGPQGALVYSSYLGGVATEYVSGLAADRDGNMLVAGFVNSANFPVVNAFQAASFGGESAFLTKIAPAGGTLVFSTYFGGATGYASGAGVGVDAAGNIYLGGYTGAGDLPVANAFQGSNAGGQDGFVAKFTPDGQTLVYSSYFGGSGFDAVGDVDVSADGHAFLTGYTLSPDLPTRDPLQPFAGGTCGSRECLDTFVAEVDEAGALAFSTFVGGNGEDFAYDLAANDSGSVYVITSTFNNRFPTTAGAFDSTGLARSAFFKITTRVILDWDAPPFFAPAGKQELSQGPQRLRVLPFDTPVDNKQARGAADPAKRGQLPEVIAYKVYSSPTPGVPTGGTGDVLGTVGPERTSFGPITPRGGTYFVVTACLSDGTETDPSNEASVNVPAPVITTLRVTSTKIIATGTGFENGVDVALDRTLFELPSKMKAKKTKKAKLTQKGRLTSGESVGEYVFAHDQKALVLFRDRSTGGISAVQIGE